MSIKEATKYFVVPILVLLTLTGCANNGYVEPDMKKAMLIMAKKIENLERIHGLNGARKSKHPTVHAQPKKIKRSKNKTTRRAVAQGKVYSYKSQNKYSKKLHTIPSGTRVTLVSCDRYGWCRMRGRSGYVQGWKFKK